MNILKFFAENSLHQTTSAEIYQTSSADLTALRAAIVAGTATPPPKWNCYHVMDGLLAGTSVSWNGESFSPAGQLVATDTLNASIASITSTNSAGDTIPVIVHSLTIPGFLMGKNSRLTIKSTWLHTDAATVRHMAIAIGGTIVSIKNSPALPTLAPETGTYLTGCFQNCNSFDLQYANLEGAHLTENTLDDVVLDFVAYWDGPVVDDTLSLEWLTIEMTDMRP